MAAWDLVFCCQVRRRKCGEEEIAWCIRLWRVWKNPSGFMGKVEASKQTPGWQRWTGSFTSASNIQFSLKHLVMKWLYVLCTRFSMDHMSLDMSVTYRLFLYELSLGYLEGFTLTGQLLSLSKGKREYGGGSCQHFRINILILDTGWP